jgi:oxygen-independent coproporphyrinogen-3 oxidase
MIAAPAEIGELLAGSPYQAYSYAYPHKTAYRPLTPPLALADVWRTERQDALFLYIHLPFCEFRCGFCNLFTLAQPAAELPAQYLTALRRQAEASRAALPSAEFVRLALGGGTPTFLSERELESLFEIVTDTLDADPRGLGASCEASPATITAGKLALLRDHGVTRLSLGIQSFHEADAHAMGRPQRAADVETALELLNQAAFPVLNLDLIYGGETQTVRSWLDSVERAIAAGAGEIYLYPLYVRPLTGLSRQGHQWDDWRLLLYREARDLLLARGYEQVSMRMFRLANSASDEGPVYCCQDDGMLGLGCGARSYTRSLHYSREYAVGTRAIAGILADYLACSYADFGQAYYGIVLDHDERRRRVLILSLLQCEGLPRAFYRQRFATDVLADFPELALLEEAGLAEIDADCVRLTAAGIERSDAVGPWLYSPAVRAKMEAYAWR